MQKLSNKDVEILLAQCRNEDMMSIHAIHKHAFLEMLIGLKLKVMSKTGEEAQRQLTALERMENFLDRMTYYNVLYIMQTKILARQDSQILILEQQKRELEEELIQIKKRIGSE